MDRYNRDSRSGGGRSFNKPRFQNDRTDRPDMHKATCANCGKICEVPFKPTGSKPVYCRDCFRQQDGGGDSRSDGNRSFGRSNNEDRQMFDAVCANCGKNCQVPFRPSPGRDIFCSDCFEKNEDSGSSRSFDKPRSSREASTRTETPNYKEQLDALNVKLDKILRLLGEEPTTDMPVEVVVAPIEQESKEAKEEVIEKPKKTKAAPKAKKAVSSKKK